MPKKFQGENTKVAASRVRKEAVARKKELEKTKELEQKEALEWSKGAKKNDKYQQKIEKMMEKSAKKAEKQALLVEEDKELAKMKKVKIPRSKKVTTDTKPINKSLELNESELNELVELGASNIDDALDLLSITDTGNSTNQLKLESHPEKRVKAAFKAFKERELPILKKENPTLRSTQLQELLKKKWKKSPDNPFNQITVAYNASQGEKEQLVSQVKSSVEIRLAV